MTDPIWCIMPVLAGPELTEAAISDLLAQSVPTKILIINQGVDEPFRDRLERIAERYSARVYVWHHNPPLPSLSASWNLGLELAWQAGGKVALVVNNDVRLHRRTLEILQAVQVWTEALFISAVGVTQEQFDHEQEHDLNEWLASINRQTLAKGGPDFSCFLIARECHQSFPFDEGFIPAFCEDLDYHRRLMLAGEGQRIFSINLPYLHYASQTLKLVSAPDAERIRGAIEHQSRAYYAKKWGGPVNSERFGAPFMDDGGSVFNLGQVTTPELQRRVAAGLPPIGCPMHDDQPIDCPLCEQQAQEWADTNQQEDERAQGPESAHGDVPGADDGGLRGAAD